MACIVLRDMDGNERVIPEGTPYRLQLTEAIVGVKHDCEGVEIKHEHEGPTMHQVVSLAQELDAEIGGGKGDWIKTLAAPVAKLVGKTACSQCEARRIATNAYARLKKKYGQLDALLKMKELWLMSSDPDATLRKLKEYLDT